MDEYGLSDKITLRGIEKKLGKIETILLRQEEILQALLEAIRQEVSSKAR